ncbi:hypothetical protein [Billgrantia endophytica]|uniref:Uncharacterized protein n=1 Tax=Billgrantia endophytica TaxID=2033802 RepID=A0A2N7TUA8_9GAMM|nr:hypothetical protein [Halomonas endophytica]PMR71782.1 hypothetical protein C1H69_22885 [Halomonas endophytica]
MKNYVLFKSTYSRDKIDDIFEENIEVSEKSLYTKEDQNETNNMVYVDGWDVYLYFDGFNIGVNDDLNEIMWSRVDDETKQLVVTVKGAKKIQVEQAPEAIKQLEKGGSVLEKIYNFGVDVEKLDPENKEQAKKIELMRKDHVNYINEFTAFVKNPDNSYTSVYYRVIHHDDGKLADLTDKVDLTKEQYEKIIYLFKK